MTTLDTHLPIDPFKQQYNAAELSLQADPEYFEPENSTESLNTRSYYVEYMKLFASTNRLSIATTIANDSLNKLWLLSLSKGTENHDNLGKAQWKEGVVNLLGAALAIGAVAGGARTKDFAQFIAQTAQSGSSFWWKPQEQTLQGKISLNQHETQALTRDNEHFENFKRTIQSSMEAIMRNAKLN